MQKGHCCRAGRLLMNTWRFGSVFKDVKLDAIHRCIDSKADIRSKPPVHAP
jgi:hypothetical protein